jgi:hypothetical protein
MTTVGSIVHGAYGDYFEQLLCLKHFKRSRPYTRLVVFFASEERLRDFKVFDLSFADEIHCASRLSEVSVDRFLQYQVLDPELQDDILSKLPQSVLTKIDLKRNIKPWSIIRRLDFDDPYNDLPLSDFGHSMLPACMADNDIDPNIFETELTVGFLWRYRDSSGAVSPFMQSSEAVIRSTKTALLKQWIEQKNAKVLICGMASDKRDGRIDPKFAAAPLELDPRASRHLKGLSWGLELEILSRCSICVVMASGFSEALWIKRQKASPTVLVDAPPHYLAKAIYNRMPLFELNRLPNLFFQLRQPHTPERVLRHIEGRRLLPAHNS